MPHPLERRKPRRKRGSTSQASHGDSHKADTSHGAKQNGDATLSANVDVSLRSGAPHPERRLSTLPEKLISEAQNVGECGGSSSHFDMVIVGAGVAGAATAASLGRLHPDMRILVIERSMGEDVDKRRIIGELMQPDGVRLLKILGISGMELSFMIRWLLRQIVTAKPRSSSWVAFFLTCAEVGVRKSNLMSNVGFTRISAKTSNECVAYSQCLVN